MAGSGDESPTGWLEQYVIPAGTPAPTAALRAPLTGIVLSAEEMPAASLDGDGATPRRVWSVRWASREAATERRTDFLRWAGIDPATVTLRLAGSAAPMRLEGPPCAFAFVGAIGRFLAGRKALWGWLIGGASLFTISAALQQHYALLLESPAPRWTGEGRPIHLMIGRAIPIELPIENRSSLADSRLLLDDVNILTVDGLTWEPDAGGAKSLSLSPGGVHVLRGSIRTDRPGRTRTKLVASARSGWLPGRCDCAFDLDVEGWHAFGPGRFEVMEESGAGASLRRVTARGEIEIGKPIERGRRLLLSLSRASPDMSIRLVYGPIVGATVSTSRSLPDPAGHVVLNYAGETAVAEAFQRVTLALVLVSTNTHPLSRWKETVETTTAALR
jgi:hypothetical protein